MRVKKQRIIVGYILIELLLLCLTTVIVSFGEFMLVGIPAAEEISQSILVSIVLVSSWVLTIFLSSANDYYVRSSFAVRIKSLATNVLILLGLSSLAIFIAGLNTQLLGIITKTIGLFFILDIVVLQTVQKVFGARKNYKSFGAKMLVLGAGDKGKQVLNFVQNNKHLGYDVVGFLDDDYPASNGINLLGKMQDLPEVLNTKPVDEIVIALPMERKAEINTAIKLADNYGVRVNIVPELPSEVDHNYKTYNLGPLPVYQLKQIPLDHFHNFAIKKAFDILFASFVLIFFSPLFLLIALLIKLESKGPVFYKPIRKGQAGGNFVCYKFRTMKENDSESGGTKSTVKNDPRITRIGKYLRKYDLDELPQFINVLKGDMSVVGPRPHRINLNDDFRKVVNDYMVRHYVKPGLSGWAQVNGWRGPTETEEQKRQRIEHDLWYMFHWSLWLDIKIIFLTVFSRKTRVNAF